MSDLIKTDPSEEIYNIQQSFKSRLVSKIDDIESCWQGLLNEDAPDFSNFHLLLHSLVGTSGTFSAVMVSSVSRKIEVVAKSLLHQESILNDDIKTKLDHLFIELRQASDKWQPSTIPFIPEASNKNLIEEPHWVSTIYLVEDDVEIVLPITDFLEKNGYKVFYYREIKEFEETYDKSERASAIIMDMSFKEGHIAGAETIKRLSETDENFPPVIFISVHNDIQARLAAAHAGAKRYFTKPVNHQNLLTSLDNLTNRTIPDAYRILLIDDNQETLDYYSNVLKQHGFETLSFTSPLKGYEAIDSFNADLIVLDLYMPECSGLDLARVIRQNDDFAQIPIVFLSAEFDLGAQLSAMDLGGDDFLMKPVDPSHFVQAVIARVKRSRRISNLNKTLRDTVRESEYRLVTLDQHAIVSMADVNGIITHVNKHFIKVSGYQEIEILGKDYNFIQSKISDDVWNSITTGVVWHGHVCNRAKDGSEYWLEMTIVPFIDEKGIPYKYVFVGTDITKLKVTERDLIKAKEEAERANKAKSNFLSRMSHELRTPMNAICGFAQLLKNNYSEADDELQLDYTDEIIQASEHLLCLINETLNLAKIESGNVELSIEKVHLTEICIESLSLVTPLAEKRKISFDFKIDNKPISFEDFSNITTCVAVDRIRFKQVLLNIFSNAVKYNYENGTVSINCETVKKSNVRICITDTGKGLEKDLLPDLFTEFNRLGEEDSKIEGTGMGLMITKNLTELMGGKIGVESELGKGTTFWIELPLSS